MKKIVVYTCITGGYDKLKPIRFSEPNIDFICYTDSHSLSATGWQSRQIPDSPYSGAELNRHIKMMPHIYLHEYDYSIYVDGNIEIVAQLTSLLDLALRKYSVALYQHPFRNCIYDEAMMCLTLGYDWYWNVITQIERYKKKGYGKSNGLFECSVIFRNHRDQEVIILMERWWDEYFNGTKRDQISLPVLAWELGVRINNMGKSDPRYEKKFFSLGAHHISRVSFFNLTRSLFNRLIITLFRHN